jgi:hypothetical protein
MKNTTRNLTLSAAALAALVSIAPKASAEPWKNFPLPPSPHQVREMLRDRHESPRLEFRGRDDRGRTRDYGNRGYGSRDYGARGYAGRGYVYGGYERERFYAAPVRPFRPLGLPSPFRVLSGFRFYSSCPGPGYVYIANNGWVLPPYPGAVWIPGHYDVEGYWVEGFWD